MKLVKSPFVFGALVAAGSASSITAQAQIMLPQSSSAPSSRSYTTVDASGNRSVTTVQTPLADAKSTAGLIAGQGVLGSRTTSSTTLSYGSSNGSRFGAFNDRQPRGAQPYPNYGSPYAAPYCPPAYPNYGYPAYSYPYPYPNTNVNNYYYPAQPYTLPIGPAGYNNSITVFPPITTYTPYGNPPLYPTYPFPGAGYPTSGYPNQGYPTSGYPNQGYPTAGFPTPYSNYPYPTYTGTYINGSGYGGFQNQSQSSGFSVTIGKSGVSGGFGNQKSSSSTTIIRR